MTWWLIEPRDPLIVRDGRPFGPNPGARASSLEFPYPSTVVGGVRTRAGLDGDGEFTSTHETIDAVKRISIRGPLLAALTPNGELKEWLLPAPADALLVPALAPQKTSTEDKDQEKCKQQGQPIYGKRLALTPRAASDVITDLPEPLLPVRLLTPKDPGKPESRAPRYWTWTQMAKWLGAATDDTEPIALTELGSSGPMREYRTHVSVQSATQTAQDGALFQTSGLEFQQRGEQRSLSKTERLALVVQVDTSQSTHKNVLKGLAPLGGERRLVQWREMNQPADALALKLPEDVVRAVIEKKRCRVVLATPAYFENGYAPAFLCQPCKGVTPHLQAAAVRRAQVVSGWDFTYYNPDTQQRGRPKPTRRLAAAGSVYWLKLDYDLNDAEAIERWLNAVWLHCISDDKESREDGFGLALIGSWTHETGENS